MSRSLDRVTLLETFARTSDRGSISAAARDLGLSQASASRQLRDLEDRMGVELIRRTTHALTLTPAGQHFLRDARELIANWNAFEERHGDSDSTVKGSLKVVAPVALGQAHLIDIVVRFQKMHPQVSVVLDLSDDPIRFAEVGCDCWVKVGPVPDDTLIVRRLCKVERLIVAAPGVTTHLSDSPGEDVPLPFVALTPFEGDRVRLRHRAGGEVLVAVTVNMSTNNIFALHRAALSGIGAAILPRWFIEDDLASGRLEEVFPDWRAADLDINVAFLPARRRPKRLSAFLSALEEGVRAVPGVGIDGSE